MIDITSLIVMFILLIIIFKQIQYIRKLRIRTRKTIMEIIIMLAFLVVILFMTISLAKNIMHYFIAVLGVVLLFLDMFKQGISSDGILLISRGKELYYWDEISRAEINYKNKKLMVQYYDLSGVKIINHIYDNKFNENICKILKENIKIK